MGQSLKKFTSKGGESNIDVIIWPSNEEKNIRIFEKKKKEETASLYPILVANYARFTLVVEALRKASPKCCEAGCAEWDRVVLRLV